MLGEQTDAGNAPHPATARPATAPDRAAQNQITAQYWVSFEAERTARYHAARRGFFEAAHRWTLFVIVALGTAGVTGLVTRFGPKVGIDLAMIGGFTAILGALNLVFDPAGKARAHEALQRKAFELGAEIDGTVNPSEEVCASWRAALHRIYADEPPPLRALEAVVYNATLTGRRERPNDDLLVITPRQRIFKQFFSFANDDFPRRGALKKKAA